VKSKVLCSLVLLNAALLAAVMMRYTRANEARAMARAPDYLAIPSKIPSSSSGVVYVLDTTNHLLTTVSFDSGAAQNQKMKTWPTIDLDAIFNPPVENGSGDHRP
jgi:hypothetical protein